MTKRNNPASIQLESKMIKHYIAYFSPAGTTRKVAERVQQALQSHQIEVVMADLSVHGGTLASVLKDAAGPFVLWLGSPVYCDHALPPVMEQIAALPDSLRGYSVPFVTWGGVCSGFALSEIGHALAAKHLSPLAAAKIMAEHSSTWDASQPWEAGRPHEQDLTLVDNLVEQVLQLLQGENPQILDLAKLNYLSKAQQADVALKSLDKAKVAMGTPKADEALCVQCGECVQICPTGAMSLNPMPQVEAELCVVCHQCVRVCPEQAFPHNGDQAAQRIAGMAAASDEEKVSAVFY